MYLMKRKLLLIAAVMSTLLAQAKDHTVVVKNDPHLPKGHTEVKIDPGIESDSVIITPGIHVTDIEVTINPSITFTSNGSIKFWVEDSSGVISEKTVNINKIVNN